MSNQTKALLKQASALPYLGYLREQLSEVRVRVRQWIPWNGDYVYESFRETRQVVIPIPEDSWSFLVALHEIGHISQGERCDAYLDEYNAERWAIKRAGQRYGIVNLDYELDARHYVVNTIITDCLHRGLDPNKIRPYVLDWIGDGWTVESVKRELEMIRCHQPTLTA